MVDVFFVHANLPIPISMKSFLCILLSCLSLGIFAQSGGTIRGIVRSPEAEVLPFASAVLYSQADSSIAKTGFTNDKGEFIFTPLRAGSYFYTISFTQLKTYRSPIIQLEAGQTVSQPELTMAPLASDMDEVKIVARKPLIEVLPDKTVFNVAGNANAIGDNGLDLLRKSPGVIVDDNNNIILMGKSGVRIYIDGKQSPLGVDDLAAMLQGMNANQIESIEIITNPSAKFDAEGNAGIINIRLKKDKNLGTNGSISGGGAIAVESNKSGLLNPKYNGSITLNHRTKAFNLFGSYSATAGTRERFFDFLRVQNGIEFDQQRVTTSDYWSQNVKVGSDFFLAKNHTLGVLFSGFFQDRDTRTEAFTPQTFVNESQPFEILEALSSAQDVRNNVNANLNYAFNNRKGVTLNMDLDYGRFRNSSDIFVPNYILVPNGDRFDTLVDRTEIFRTEAPSGIDIATFKVDHVRPFLKGQLETGLKVAYIQTDNVFNYFDILNNEDFLNLDRSNDFEYTENINAAYASYKRNINQKWNISAGLRAEQTNTLGELKDFQTDPALKSDTSFTRNYINFFPSAGVTYSPSRKQLIRFNYSRRIDRPRYENLNPFEYRIDKQSFRAGNPNLLPQYTHSLELGYTYNYRYNATLSYSYTSGFFTRITDTLDGRSTVFTFENLGSRTVYSLNLGAPIQVNKIWSMYVNTTFNYTRQFADLNEDGETGKTIDVARPTFNLFSQQTFNFEGGWAVEASGFYNSPGIWGANFLTNQFWSLNVGVQKRLLDNAMVIKVSMNDIFWGMRPGGTSVFGGLVSSGNLGWESRQAKIDLTYSFGNNQVKSSRRRKTGIDAETKRANGGDGGGGFGGK